MLDRVADQVGQQLVDAIAVPAANQVALRIHPEAAVRMRQLDLDGQLPADRVEVEGRESEALESSATVGSLVVVISVPNPKLAFPSGPPSAHPTKSKLDPTNPTTVEATFP